ncbi:MAG: hypothetical protein JWO53_623, partial [Chlamydiia bacterium]|nr:hypothetical protein [Chlamydiia bacterium]
MTISLSDAIKRSLVTCCLITVAFTANYSFAAQSYLRAETNETPAIEESLSKKHSKPNIEVGKKAIPAVVSIKSQLSK